MPPPQKKMTASVLQPQAWQKCHDVFLNVLIPMVPLEFRFIRNMKMHAAALKYIKNVMTPRAHKELNGM